MTERLHGHRTTPDGRIAVAAATLLASALLGLAWIFMGGPRGWLYLVIFAVALVPGLPLGFALFGSRHAAGWIAGALAGYGMSAVALWVPVQAGVPSPYALAAAWLLAAILGWLLLWARGPIVPVPVWKTRDTAVLLLMLLVVPLLVWKPFGNIGRVDRDGSRLYRAYFTADFLWHGALTAEIARLPERPRNPYAARRPLNYYWAYFIPPAVITRFVGALPVIERNLIVNALCAGVLFVAAVFVAAWCAVPRAGPVAIATLLVIVAASAEGWHAIWRLSADGRPLSELRDLNIDAMTSWVFRGLTIDGLPRSLWYTPQHAAACALSSMALIVAAAAPARRPLAGVLAGALLALAVIFSPFLGGTFALIYGGAALWVAARDRSQFWPSLMSTTPAALPFLGGLLWCVAHGTFEGAGAGVVVGLSVRAAAAPVLTPMLAVGPVLALSVAGIFLGRRRGFRCEPATAALCVGFGLLYLVTLRPEPIWVGWRAGQIMLVTMPALAASFLASTHESGHPRIAAASAILAAVLGLPTTIIDTYNAQDVENRAMGPGFRWTVAVPPDTQLATQWIRENTPPEAVVQASVRPRGRETWTLLPTFAQRRSAGGRPISLLHDPEYDELSNAADAMFGAVNPDEAWALARRLDVDYIYADAVERAAFGEAAIQKFDDPRYFARVFAYGNAVVFAVR